MKTLTLFLLIVALQIGAYGCGGDRYEFYMINEGRASGYRLDKKTGEICLYAIGAPEGELVLGSPPLALKKAACVE